MIHHDNRQNTIPFPMTARRPVTDFKFSIDLAPYICQQWSRITMKAGRYVSLRDLFEQYTLSDRGIKQIVLHKKICGLFKKDIHNRIMAFVRSTGYEGSIDVVNEDFLLENWSFALFCLHISFEKYGYCGSFFFQTEPFCVFDSSTYFMLHFLLMHSLWSYPLLFTSYGFFARSNRRWLQSSINIWDFSATEFRLDYQCCHHTFETLLCRSFRVVSNSLAQFMNWNKRNSDIDT